jgi:cytochrome c553
MASPLKMLAAVLIAGGLLPGGVSLTACQTAPQQGVARGETLFRTCEPCHGAAGLGNQAIAAPGIAGLDSLYVQAQLHKFRSGIRGAHPDDDEGARMRPMARSLRTDEDVLAVALFVSEMTPVRPASALHGGDAAKGAAAYAVCSACHGADGKGNPTLNAPTLTGLSDWYMLAQLHKYKDGLRGVDPRDATGATMRPMAMTLVNEQAMLDVIAHIQTLP